MPDLRFEHLGVAVGDIDRAIPVYRDLFGYRVLSGPFHDPIQKATVCFVGGDDGAMVVELIAPLDTASPVNRMLAKGLGAYHVCYEADDLDATIESLRAGGCTLVAEPVPAVAFQDRRIAWLYLPTRQLIEVVERG